MEIAPLEAVKKMTLAYPNLWDTIDTFVRVPENEIQWDRKICYCPISAAITALSVDSDMLAAFGQASFVAALSSWRRGKYIYQFDETLAAEVISTVEDMVIPAEILYHMPSQCLFISLPTAENKTPDYPAGFFAHIESDTNTGERELRIHYITQSGTLLTQYIVHLIPDGTITDGINAAIAEIRKNTYNNIYQPIGEHISVYLNKARTLTIQAVQLILYICAENAEITENEAQAKIYRKSDRVIDKYREIRKWDVGVKTGIILRRNERRQNYTHDSQSANDKSGIKKRSHLRRAHWHHYWAGSGDNKKLILRWINSIIINPDEDVETPATIIKLNPEKQ
ncbi:MAG: AcrVA2 family anti-CRISPR protein [Candidatus Cryptobacteroides sp.]